MKATVVIPSHRSQATLPRTLESVRAASARFPGEVETIVSEDPEGRGAAWARNRGLERATGDVVFFVDADDAVRPDFLVRPSAVLADARADFCLFQYAQSPLKRAYDLTGNAAVREALLPAFAGYSLADVRRWNAGGDLMARREPGSVCRAAFRRAFLEAHGLRFDERLPLYEDAFFLTECALAATRVVSLRESLYDYRLGPDGATAHGAPGSARHRAYKFAALARRRELERKYGGLWPQCEASAALSAVELLVRGRSPADARRYAADPLVARALAEFPLSARHPLVACGVLACRALRRASAGPVAGTVKMV